MSLVIEKTSSGSRYCRNHCQERDELEKCLLNLYKRSSSKYGASIYCSGMNAINAVMTVLCGPNESVFVIGDELYCDTPKTCAYQKFYNPKFKFEKVDIRNTKKIFEIFNSYGKSITLFFIESASNPSGQIFDFSIINNLRKIAPNCYFCVDNTWLTVYGINPFDYGVDIVIESTTKYISAGKCIGGFVIAPNDFHYQLVDFSKQAGIFVGNDHCKIFIDGIGTLENRMIYLSELTLRVADFLEKINPAKIDRVLYPTLKSHPSFNLAITYLKLNPGIILFHLVNDDKPFKNMNECKKFLEKNKYLEFATSYGSAKSRIDQYPKIGKSNMYDYSKLGNAKQGLWIRLAIGYESEYQTIINGINQMLE